MVLAVSLVSTGRRVVVSAVSEGVDGRHAEVSVVSTSLRRRGLCAKKFALRAQNTPNSAFLPLLGEFFRENDAGVRLLGELFRAGARNAYCWANCVAPSAAESSSLGLARPVEPVLRMMRCGPGLLTRSSMSRGGRG